MNIQDSLLPCRNKSQGNSCSIASGYDHLSNLHESILSHILSKLPTKDGVQTSILSKEWKYNWTSMRHMKIKSIPPYLGYKESFADFVERILSLVQNLTSFSMKYFGSDSKRAITWIYDLFRRDNIESLQLSCMICFRDTNHVLPWSLLDKLTLKNLKLRFPGCAFKIDAVNSFVSLTRFHLYGIQIVNGNSSSHTLIINFPVLERFEVMRCKFENVNLVKIYAPLLTTFISNTDFSQEPNDYCIEVIGTMVSTFKSSGDLPENVILTGSQVASACFQNEYVEIDDRLLRVIGSHVGTLLNESSKLNELEISDILVRALLHPSVPPFRPHNELKRLILKREFTTVEQLSKLLHAAPSLNFLSINVCKWKKFDKKPLEPCIVSHLEEVVLDGFWGKATQYNLAKCFLKNGKVLKKVVLDGPEPRDYDRCVKVLSQFRRSSTKLMIVFVEKQGPVTFVVDKIDQSKKAKQQQKKTNS